MPRNIENLDDAESGKIREKKELSEQDMGNVGDNLKKAKKVWGQIKKSQKENNLIASMLTIILQNIENNGIITQIYFLIEHHTINIIPEIFIIIYPFLQNKIGEDSYKNLLNSYPNLINIQITSVVEYASFIKDHMSKSEIIKNIKHDFFIEFIKNIIYYFNIGNFAEFQTNNNNIQILTESLQKEIYH